ncbi:YheC/YheD family protein [Brevibacillus massiliensis]|jgi:hypothetical protein|uniref:YheC/YheD family endospore coat-associated protein n=1 Tax=Brevibacillus massiliensis TaxID=1118054 RepID=UPI00030CD188|nr:YheC/YheD family protein [Brevibacillus massiliensis]
MQKLHPGWLTVTPSGRWCLQSAKSSPLPSLLRRQKKTVTFVGPLMMKKLINIVQTPVKPRWIRTKIRWVWSDNRLIIGPMIGILTAGDGVGFKGNKENFKDLFNTGKRLGALVFVFTPKGIDWKENRIQGYLYDDKLDAWHAHVMPFPHVVYNRIPTRKLEKMAEVSKTLDKLAATPNILLFNRRFFNKNLLFKRLEKHPEAASFLPYTKKLETYSQLRLFCSLFPFVYLKPVSGKAGKGIMRLERKNNKWFLQQVHQQNSISLRFLRLEEVWNYLKEQTKNKGYIIQQGIPLARFKGRPFDVRVLVQKDGSGKWGVTGIGIRRAGVNSITTHVPRGGSIQSTSAVLTHVFAEQAQEIRERIEEAALIIAHSLNEEVESLAEMSMDFGLTPQGRLWFFEANAKPEKFDEPSIRRSSLANLIRFAQHVFTTEELLENLA